MQPELPPQSLFEAHKALVADYQVIEQLYVEEMCCLHELLRHIDIFGRRGGIAAGMVVTHNYVGTVAHDGGPKYFG